MIEYGPGMYSLVSTRLKSPQLTWNSKKMGGTIYSRNIIRSETFVNSFETVGRNFIFVLEREGAPLLFCIA